jgi:acetyl-CoA carboxylase biotin carboxyl carrier protein
VKFEEIEKLVRLVAETGVSEVEIKQAGVQVRVSRMTEQPAAPPQVHVLPIAGAAMGHGVPAALPTGAPAQPALPAGEAPESPPEEEEGLIVIKSSMVGTYYPRPSPDSAAFAPEGSVLKKGQVICILEAMKIMNEIESDVAGTVVKHFLEEGQPVAFGEPILVVRPL